MEKQPNQLLWHGIFLLLVLAAIFGIYKAVQAVDYTWRWERIP
ncbi:amino acid ABC transporter permease, partial [Aeromonas sp. CPF2-S1]|nr:amino acid ABC transporter permease [Aeromonas sp. CPF2-S1]